MNTLGMSLWCTIVIFEGFRGIMNEKDEALQENCAEYGGRSYPHKEFKGLLRNSMNI